MITYDIYCIITNIFGFVNIYFANCCPFCAKKRCFNGKTGKYAGIAAKCTCSRSRQNLPTPAADIAAASPRRALRAPACAAGARLAPCRPDASRLAGRPQRLRRGLSVSRLFSHPPRKCRIPIYSPQLNIARRKKAARLTRM